MVLDGKRSTFGLPGGRSWASSWSGAVFLVLLCVLVLGVYGTFGRYHDVTLYGITICLAGLVSLLATRRQGFLTSYVTIVVGLGLAVAVLVDLCARDPLEYAWLSRPQTWRHAVPALAAVGLLVWGWVTGSRRAAPVVLACAALAFGAYLAAQLHRSPEPVMDVWTIGNESADALLAGRNPYTQVYSDPYEGSEFVGPDYAQTFNYLPGMALQMAVPRLLGLDARWLSLAAMVGGLFLFAMVVRRGEGAHPWSAVWPGAALIIFWFNGGQAFLLEQAWPESLILVYVCLALWAWQSCQWMATAALILALTMKQTTWFCFPFVAALAIKERRWKLCVIVTAGVTLIVGPFFLWDTGAFFRNVVTSLTSMPPRDDGLGWGAWCIHNAPGLFGYVTKLSFLTYAAALVCLVLRLRRATGREAVLETLKWMALGLFGFFLFLKVAFYNYYYLVMGLLAFYAVMQSRADLCERTEGEP